MAKASFKGARRNDGPTDNTRNGLYAGPTDGRDKADSITAIGPNKVHPITSGITATGPFVNGKVPTRSQN